MLNALPVLHVTGLLLSALGLTMLLPAIIDIADGNPDWQVFAASGVVTWTVGILMAVATRRPGRMQLNMRQAFLMTTAVWIAFAAFAALPFLGLGIGYSDAFFETISGMTTTGSTVLTNLEQTAPGILFWRALLQWIGGIGIVVMAIIILPFLRVGGLQLFHTESSDRSEKVVARATQLIGYIASVYVGLTAACAVAYALGGMSVFDAICHSMTTLSTGGYANYDASFGHFDSPAIHWTAAFFMVCGGLPFIAYIRAVRGEPLSLWRDPQARAFVGLILGAGIGMGLWLGQAQDLPALEALRLGMFNVVSVVTTTGYAVDDYGAWGPFAVAVFFILMFVGGCTGSTSGAIKIFRLQVLWLVVRTYLRRLARPNRAMTLRYNGKRLPDDVPYAVLAFIAVFLGTIALFTIILAAMGLDLVTALSGATTAITNVGPGLGEIIGPAGNFAPLPDGAKWVLSLAMLLGRLELFTVLVLLDPDFWKS